MVNTHAAIEFVHIFEIFLLANHVSTSKRYVSKFVLRLIERLVGRFESLSRGSRSLGFGLSDSRLGDGRPFEVRLEHFTLLYFRDDVIVLRSKDFLRMVDSKLSPQPVP